MCPDTFGVNTAQYHWLTGKFQVMLLLLNLGFVYLIGKGRSKRLIIEAQPVDMCSKGQCLGPKQD